MTEYIDKAALLVELHAMGGTGSAPNTWERGYDDAIDAVYEMVEKLGRDGDENTKNEMLAGL